MAFQSDTFQNDGFQVGVWSKTGTGSMGCTAGGARNGEFNRSGTGILQGTAQGESGGTTGRTGGASMGLAGSGVGGRHFETTGKGQAGFWADGTGRRESVKAGTGWLGWKAEGFTTDRVIAKTGGAAMGFLGSGGFVGPGIAGIDTILLLEALTLRGGRIGMPLMPVNRR